MRKMLIMPRIEMDEEIRKWEAGKTSPPPTDVPRCLPLPFYASLGEGAILAIAPDIILCVITPFKTIAFDLVQIKKSKGQRCILS